MPGLTCLLITGPMKLKPMKLMAPSDPIAALNAGGPSLIYCLVKMRNLVSKDFLN